MKVKVAETAGFCFGVKRAVDKVYQLIEDGVSPIYTLGPIIHNEEVVSDLESRGVRVIEVENLDHIKSGTVVIRSHGVGREIYEKLKENGLEYVDVTCPFVLKTTGSSRKKALLGNRSSFRRSEASGGAGNLRMVPWSVQSPQKQRRCREYDSGSRYGSMRCITDDI